MRTGSVFMSFIVLSDLIVVGWVASVFVGYHLIYTVGNGNAPVLRIVQYWI
ncbi:hypothetical protein [Barnesiella intestinihominis]|uniref:hypothetical protein n=1 Tax=Barnesiella intestinihominis TaxID=487174 RepID=UPI003AB12709